MYKHLIWDFDGTLFDTYPVMTKLIIQALEMVGVEEKADKVMGLMKISYPTLLDYCQSHHQINIDELMTHYNTIRHEVEVEHFKPFDYVYEICENVSQNEGKNYLYTHRDNSAIVHMERYGLTKFFSGYITKENNFKRKPHPEALQHLLTTMNIPLEEAIMIGDREIDLQAGKNAGIHACYFTNGEPLYSQYADISIKEFKELMDLILA